MRISDRTCDASLGAGTTAVVIVCAVTAWLVAPVPIVGVVLGGGLAVLAPAVGGGVAGYRHGCDGLRIGGAAGSVLLVSAVPVYVLVAFQVTLMQSMGHVPTPPAWVTVTGVFVSILLFAGAYFVGLGAVGGYVGERSDRVGV